MFEVDDRPGYTTSMVMPVVRYVGHYVAVCFLGILSDIPLAGLLAHVGLTGDTGGPAVFAGFDLLGCLFCGWMIGWCAGLTHPPLAAKGRWIWLPGTALLICAALGSGWLDLLFYIETGLKVLFFTAPACVTLGYSAGTALTRMRRGRVAIAVVCLVAFAFSPIVMSLLKRRLFEDALHVRQVWGPAAIALAPDSGGICGVATRSSVPAITVRPGAVLESIQTVACVNGELITDRHLTRTELTEAGGFELERVRVVAGDHKGVEGWVVSSRLHRPVTSSAD